MTKYRAIRTTIDGVTFASRKEALRYCELKMLLDAGKIRNLELQPRFPIIVNGQKICEYRADFRYIDLKKKSNSGAVGTMVVEDVKSKFTVKNREYIIKKKLVHAIYPGVTIEEII